MNILACGTGLTSLLGWATYPQKKNLQYTEEKAKVVAAWWELINFLATLQLFVTGQFEELDDFTPTHRSILGWTKIYQRLAQHRILRSWSWCAVRVERVQFDRHLGSMQIFSA